MINNKKFVKLDDALDLIDEGDVLLFKGKGCVSSVIQRAGEGGYSHVGLATWHNGRRDATGSSLLEITEFREGKGGRTVNLVTAYYDDIVNENIDIYRTIPEVTRLKFNPRTKQVTQDLIKFNAKGATNYLRSLTGLPYGWSRIWWMFQHKAFGIRLFYDLANVSNDEIISDPKKIYPVCSTAVAASYSSVGYDLMPNKSDEWMEPSDLSRSSLLNYLFTLTN
jgi:hypothetical protein